MRFPVHIATDMITWQLRNWRRGNQRYPYVLMLEPLHTCNLACLGCSPERYSGDLRDRLSLEQCFEAVGNPPDGVDFSPTPVHDVGLHRAVGQLDPQLRPEKGQDEHQVADADGGQNNADSERLLRIWSGHGHVPHHHPEVGSSNRV